MNPGDEEAVGLGGVELIRAAMRKAARQLGRKVHAPLARLVRSPEQLPEEEDVAGVTPRSMALQRAQAAVRTDERLGYLTSFDKFLVETPGGVFEAAGGALAITHLRLLTAQDNGIYQSLPHSVITDVRLETKLLRPAILTINAGSMGTMALVGLRDQMKKAAKDLEQLAGQPLPPQPTSRLVPAVAFRTLCCSACSRDQQDEWNPAPEYCHGCLRTFEWTEKSHQLVKDFRAHIESGGDMAKIPAHLWEWIKLENPRYA